MGEAERAIQARLDARITERERKDKESEVLVKEVILPAIHERSEVFLQKMADEGYPFYSTFIDWKGEKLVAWQLFKDITSETYGAGDSSLHLLSNGLLIGNMYGFDPSNPKQETKTFYFVPLQERIDDTKVFQHYAVTLGESLDILNQMIER